MPGADGDAAEVGLETGTAGREATGNDDGRCSTCSQYSAAGNGRIFVPEEQPWVLRAAAKGVNIASALVGSMPLHFTGMLHWGDDEVFRT